MLLFCPSDGETRRRAGKAQSAAGIFRETAGQSNGPMRRNRVQGASRETGARGDVDGNRLTRMAANMLSRKSLLVGLGVAGIAAVAAILVVVQNGNSKTVASKEAAAVPVTTASVVTKSVPMRLVAVGNVEAYTTVSVKARVDGQIVAVRFKEGERVRTANINPATHTRLPRYARGKAGTVEAIRGCHVFPDSAAIGAGDNPQWLYTVVFSARELWGEDADPTISVSIDAFEPYLTPLISA